MTYQATRWSSLSPELLANIAAGLFILPFVVFSGLAGPIGGTPRQDPHPEVGEGAGDRHHDGGGLRPCAAPGGAGVVRSVHDGRALDFFAPAKYGLLPQVLDAGELVGGNACWKPAPFLAILLGTLAAGLLAATATPRDHGESGAGRRHRVSHQSGDSKIRSRVAPVSIWTGIHGLRRWTICAPRASRVPCCFRCWEYRGSGSMAPWCWYSCRCTATAFCMEMSRWSRSPSSRSPRRCGLAAL